MPDAHLPTVEMLWESLDPRAVLADRFGVADVGSAARWVGATVRDHWDVRVETCERIVLSDTNALAWLTTGSGRMIAKWSVAPARFRRLAQVADLTAWLDDHGLPVSSPVRALDGRLQVEVDGTSTGLQRVVTGDLLDVEDLDQVRAAGAVLARLHLALASYPGTDELVPIAGRPGPLVARVEDWLDSPGEQVPAPGLAVLRRLLADVPTDLPPIQLLHGDFRSSNILCTDREVAAVIDLEEARVDHCVDELARSAVMLGTRFRDWGPVTSRVRAELLAGYQSVRRLTPAEARWWDVLVLRYSLALVPAGADPTSWRASALDLSAQLAGRG